MKLEQIILYDINSFLNFPSYKSFIIIVLIFFISPNESIGQTSNAKLDGFSINPKFGLYKAFEDKEGFTGGAELNVLKQNFLFSAEYYEFEEFVLFESPTEHFNQLGLMVGKYNDNGIFRLQYQLGLGLMWGVKRTELIIKDPPIFFNTQFESKDFIALGVATKIGFKIIPFSFLSIGIDLQANINLENTVFIPFISVEIGKLRY